MSYYYNYENANVENATTNTNATNATTNSTANATTNANATTTNIKPNAKPKIYEDFLIFGNFFGLVPEAYVKYFNLCCHLLYITM